MMPSSHEVAAFAAQRGPLGGADQGERQHDDDDRDRGAENYQAPVDSVGQQADRPLQDQSPGLNHRHQQADRGRRYRRTAEEIGRDVHHRGIHEADREAAHGGDRRHPIEAAHADRDHLGLSRGLGTGQRNRDQSEGEEAAHHHDQLRRRDVEDADQELAAGHRQRDGDGVDRDHLTARGVGRPIVDPAVDHGGQPGDADAVDDPKSEPEARVDRDLEQQRGDRGGRSEGGESANVADGADHPGADHAADHEPQGVGRGDQTSRELAGFREPEAHGEKGAKCAVRQLEDRRCGDHRHERHQLAFQHGSAARRCAAADRHGSAAG